MLCSAPKRARFNDDDDSPPEEENQDEIQIPDWALSKTALGIADADVDATPVEEEKEWFEPRMLPSRRRELKEHGKPGPRSTCFLCCYVGERDTLLPEDDVNKIVEYIRKNIGFMHLSALATQVASFYAPFRERINAQLQPGERPLPPMTAATVIDHLRTHHHDPEVKLIMMLDEAQEVRQCILKSVLERSSRTKKTRANKVQVDCYTKVLKEEMQLQTKDPSKMTLYSAGARIDPTLHKQGPVAMSNKKMYDFWRRAARK